MANQMVYSGQRVITSQGRVVTVAYLAPDGRVFAYDGRGGVAPITVLCDAWGGEHDQSGGHPPQRGTGTTGRPTNDNGMAMAA